MEGLGGQSSKAAAVAEMLALPIEQVQAALDMFGGHEELAIDHLLSAPTPPAPKFAKPAKHTQQPKPIHRKVLPSLRQCCIECICLHHHNYSREHIQLLTPDLRYSDIFAP